MAGIAGHHGSPVKRIDWGLLVATAALMIFGFLSLYSVGLRDGESYIKKHLLMAAIGIGPFLVFYLVNPKQWQRAAPILYVANLALLAAVLMAGTTSNGAQRWIDLKFMQFQPSELAKILTVVTLAAFFASRSEKLNRLSTFALSFLHVAVPAFLIAKQPHYGGAMVLIVVWLCISIAAGVPMRFVVIALACLSIGAVAAVKIPGVLRGYHIKRLKAMRHEDRQGVSYQQDRAQIALGAGGITGVGLFKGKQTLPEQQNDFIFTVLAEELGLVGSFMMVGAFGFFFYRVWLIMFSARDPYYRMLAAGVLATLAFHTIVNLAMVLHIFPVVGLWLPFMSAGGTALWLCMASVGLMLNVRKQEKPLLF